MLSQAEYCYPELSQVVDAPTINDIDQLFIQIVTNPNIIHNTILPTDFDRFGNLLVTENLLSVRTNGVKQFINELNPAFRDLIFYIRGEGFVFVPEAKQEDRIKGTIVEVSTINSPRYNYVVKQLSPCHKYRAELERLLGFCRFNKKGDLLPCLSYGHIYELLKSLQDRNDEISLEYAKKINKILWKLDSPLFYITIKNECILVDRRTFRANQPSTLPAPSLTS